MEREADARASKPARRRASEDPIPSTYSFKDDAYFYPLVRPEISLGGFVLWRSAGRQPWYQEV